MCEDCGGSCGQCKSKKKKVSKEIFESRLEELLGEGREKLIGSLGEFKSRLEGDEELEDMFPCVQGLGESLASYLGNSQVKKFYEANKDDYDLYLLEGDMPYMEVKKEKRKKSSDMYYI